MESRLSIRWPLAPAWLLDLRWDEVDFKRERIVLGNLDEYRTKTSQGRIIPLTPKALSTLRSTKLAQASKPSPWVLPNPKTGKPQQEVKRFWYGVCIRAGFTPAENKVIGKNRFPKSGEIHFHDLRHTFASWAINRGVPERIVQAWLGHKTRSMTGRYAHPSEEALQEAARLFGGSTKHDTGPADFSDKREVP